MERQAVVGVLFDPVVHLSRLLHRIDVDHGKRQVLQVMEELMAYLGGHSMRLRDR